MECTLTAIEEVAVVDASWCEASDFVKFYIQIPFSFFRGEFKIGLQLKKREVFNTKN